MVKAMVSFESVSKAKEFVNICSDLTYNIELVSGPYEIDAKSIMGIFSLDLSKPIAVHAHCNSLDQLKKDIGAFVTADTAAE